MKKKLDFEFVPVDNVFFGELKLTPEQLYLYSFLHSRRSYWTESYTETNISFMMEHVRFLKKERDNKERIIGCLFGLREMGILLFDCTESEVKKGKTFEVRFQSLANYKDGWEAISYDVIKMTNDSEEFMVLCYLKKYEKLRLQFSYIELASVLGCSERHAKDLIPVMAQKGLIDMRSGKPYVNEQGEVRREKNSYLVNDMPASTDATESLHSDEDITLDNNSVIGSKSSSDEQRETRPHNWYGKGQLTVSDIEIMKTTNDVTLKGHAQNRLERISKSEKGSFIVQKLLNEYEQRKNHKKWQEEERNKLLAMSDEQLEYLGHITTENTKPAKIYKPKDHVDISHMVDDDAPINNDGQDFEEESHKESVDSSEPAWLKRAREHNTEYNWSA